jgi:hypothetical protein
MLEGYVLKASSHILLMIEPVAKSQTMIISSQAEVIIIEPLTTKKLRILPECAENFLRKLPVSISFWTTAFEAVMSNDRLYSAMSTTLEAELSNTKLFSCCSVETKETKLSNDSKDMNILMIIIKKAVCQTDISGKQLECTLKEFQTPAFLTALFMKHSSVD